jgi:hypothetical protein
MKKKPSIDVSRFRIERNDTDADLMIKLRRELPAAIKELARQIGELEWSLEERVLRRAGAKSNRGERAKFIRERELEYLRDLTPAQRQEIAERIFTELKTRRQILGGA